MSLIQRAKAAFRLTPLYQPVLRRKARRQERRHLALHAEYQRVSKELFSPPGHLARARAMLDGRTPRHAPPKSSSAEVRLFVLNKQEIGGPWFEAELERSFDTVTFSMTRHLKGFLEGEADLLTLSSGVNVKDLSEPGVSLSEATQAEWLDRLQRDLLEAVGRAHAERPIDLLFAYCAYGRIFPDTLDRIRSKGIPIAMLSLDDKHAFLGKHRGGAYGPSGLTGHYDVHLTNSLECIPWYVAEGVPAFFFPQAADPEYYRPRNVPKDIDISFLGAAYGYRMEVIRSLRRYGVQVECFGEGWPNGVADDAVEIHCRSRVNLGIGETGLSGRLTCLKGRDFQLPATGNLYITTYDWELAKLFHVGEEILCYRDPMDCAGQIRYVLENPEEARRIGEAGRRRCLEEHTWTRRMESLLRWMGILAP